MCVWIQYMLCMHIHWGLNGQSQSYDADRQLSITPITSIKSFIYLYLLLFNCLQVCITHLVKFLQVMALFSFPRFTVLDNATSITTTMVVQPLQTVSLKRKTPKSW